MASISSLGVGSGLGLADLLAQLRTAENQRLVPLASQQSSFKAQLTGVSALKSALDKLKTANDALAKSESFGIVKGSIDGITSTKVSSTNKAFTTTTDSKAVAGSFTIEVNNLAQAHSITSAAKTSATEPLSATDTKFVISQDNGKFTKVGDDYLKSLEIDIKAGETSLNDVRDAINKVNGTVTASVVKAKDNEYYLMLTAKNSGTDSKISVSDNDGILGTTVEKVAAQNASIVANGIAIERQSNTISDAFEGVTLTLQAKTEASKPETLTIDQDITGMKDTIKAWVDAYNSLQDTINSQTKYTAVEAGENQANSNGALLGDSTVRGIQNQLKAQLTTIQTESDDFRIFADLGITQNSKTGKLEISDTKLDKALKEEPGKVQAFFVGDNDKQGFATQTRTYLKEVLDTNEGIIKNKEDGINSTLRKLDTQSTRMKNGIEDTIARYQKQFVELDKAMTKMNGTLSSLTSMFSKL
ncbi:flagellar hook-associated protein 2 [Pectobacterium atrosepticum SCRI1043]|uniref:Flagellar hook-associated protein 2 n=1 Tax=Pectobacterium atrosepticum (strain SCRI 1043 / ATCC BAA-672) TaxID=218491 RepID=Q6D6F5_PECAS|nr:flagellar filament capping protein FliD [Pectobacterium atrosepticum]GKV84168.1 flagellar hook-associated protein 2 [Pectobacterium carotovorum subsp. carotovorum]AIA70578.1 flagellar cap protein FliD [Pectobacterium atrosepticum]AIK14656.1 flagellar hook-associated protein 2 [Pectobacterium atrosepticum]ATY91396.1 flagellar filament capping protein FliD [Pectobacterium atrosepticum]KFX26168.1 flagellar cap protein FliD [Pectobacterium atrosepticum]